MFNSTNVVLGSNNSRYSLQFNGGGITFQQGDKVGIQSLQVPYSFYNITQAYNNNSFGYKLNGATYVLTLADGFYETSDLNNSFQNLMYNNGHYLLDSNNNPYYFAQLSTNQNLYGIQYDAFVIPTSLPAGYTNPANVLYNTVTLSTPTVMQLYIPNNNFTKIIGWNAGTYPVVPQTTVYSGISSIAPNLTPVNSVIIRCSLCYNKFSNVMDSFFMFAPNVTFGSNINIQPSYPCWLDTKVGTFQSIEIQFVDQNFNPIAMKDSNISVQLLILHAQK